MPVAMISGITGQDGSYLTELLLEKGYCVHGIVRRSSTIDRPRLDHLTLDPTIYNHKLFLHYADLADITTMRRLLNRIQPEEFYHFAGQSHVGLSFEIPETTCDSTAMGTLRLLEVLRDLPFAMKFLNVGSSEIFGKPERSPQNELTSTNPTNPYGIAKTFSVQMTRLYRESFGVFACNAICYNHESPRRGMSFLTRKIVNAAVNIKLGRQSYVELGNLDASRDWGYAGDFVEGMWRILNHSTPDDFVLATGRLTSIRELLLIVFESLGLKWEDYVRINPKYARPTEPFQLVGDASKAKEVLGWTPKVNLKKLVEIMIDAEMAMLTQD